MLFKQPVAYAPDPFQGRNPRTIWPCHPIAILELQLTDLYLFPRVVRCSHRTAGLTVGLTQISCIYIHQDSIGQALRSHLFYTRITARCGQSARSYLVFQSISTLLNSMLQTNLLHCCPIFDCSGAIRIQKLTIACVGGLSRLSSYLVTELERRGCAGGLGPRE